ncbi:MAG: IS1 family transposase, partial [Bacteroidales bacterium]|nr:IS1 family transposase [Bacteroidales bacterium]
MDIKQEIKTLYKSLHSTDKVEIMNELLAAHELEGVVLKEATTAVKKKRNKKPCPHCHSINVYRRGFQNGSQAYKCNDCSKHYRETTGTPLYRIQIKEKWQSYIDLMEKGLSLSKISKELNISIQTSF